MFMNSYTVDYSFRCANGEIAHHSRSSGPAKDEDGAVSAVLKHVPEFVRQHLVSASAQVNELNRNGDLVIGRRNNY
jgi:hypothetical protein